MAPKHTNMVEDVQYTVNLKSLPTADCRADFEVEDC